MSTGLRAGTNNDGYLQVNGTDVLTALSSGHIGIGTDNPAENVHIQSVLANVLIEGTNDTVGGNVANLSLMAPYYRKVGYSIKDSAGNEDFFIGRPYGEGDSNPALVINMTGTEKVRIKNNGNVGIGTTNPVALLQVAGTDSVNTNLSIASSTSGDGGVYFYDGSNSGAITYSHSSDNMLFRVGGSERLRITSDGDLLSSTGGTATYDDITGASNAGFVIGSSSYESSGIQIRTSTTGIGRIYFGDNSGNDAGRNRGAIQYNHSNDGLTFSAGNSSTVLMYAGNFRISGAGSTSGTSQSPLAVSSNTGTITAFFGNQNSVTSLTSSQYSAAIRFNGADVAWGDIAYFPNGDNEYGSFRFGRHGSTVSSYPTASIGVRTVYTTDGISFKTTSEAAGMTSELLDDYEEGSWTPVIEGLSNTPLYDNRSGRYTKVGRLVHTMGFIQINGGGLPTYTNGSAAFVISGLPYAAGSSNSVGYVRARGNMQHQYFQYNGTFNDYGTTGEVSPGFAPGAFSSTGISFYVCGSGAVRGTVKNSSMTNGFIIEWDLTYLTD